MRAVKAALFALLAANTVYFGVSGSSTKLIDAAAWLALLALFQAEVDFARYMTDPRRRSAIRALRLIAAAGVFAAVIGYVFEDNVLDAVNAVLWIAIVLLLELELRFERAGPPTRHALRLLLGGAYAGLGVLVALWAARGMWFDAYDAVLWLAAFVLIEQSIAGRARAA